MPRILHAALLASVALVLAGCCGDTIRDMASLKDVTLKPEAKPQRRAKATTEQPVKAAKADGAVAGESAIETGSIETGSIAEPTCQGEHLAYQATKEYLKNFGPKPPDEPGEKGACKPAQ